MFHFAIHCIVDGDCVVEFGNTTLGLRVEFVRIVVHRFLQNCLHE